MSSSSSSVVSSILRVCNRSTINIDESLENSVKVIVSICLKFIDKKKLVECTSPQTYVDWNFVNEFHTREDNQGNLLGDSTIWLRFMEFISFPDTDLPDTVIRRSYPPLWCILKSVKESRVYEPNSKRAYDDKGNRLDVLTFSDACKLFIANNLEGVLCRNMSELFISLWIRRNSHVVLSNLMSSLADQRHETEVYLSTMQYILGIMCVDTCKLSAQISHYRESKQSQQHTWAMKFVEAGKSRPSMRDVAQRINRGMLSSEYGSNMRSHVRMGDGTESVVSGLTSVHEDSSLRSAQAGLGSISFEDYCDIIRFPNSMSRLLRLRCYLLASQGHIFDFSLYTSRVVPQDVAKSLNNNSITFPDVQCLCTGIESLAMNISPFQQINEFRQRCFISFAINHRRGLTMTQILHLYVSAYQKKDVWKQCWKRIYPIMSTQISKDVEAFVQSTPFAVEHFIHILKTSTPFVA